MVEFALRSVVVPIATAVVVLYTMRSFRRESIPAKYALAFALAFFVGYALMPDGSMKPARHWHWLAYAGLLAGFLAALSTHLSGVIRGVALVCFAGIAAWLLVPTWDSLVPPRQLMIPCFAAYLLLLAVTTERGCSAGPGPLSIALLGAAAAVCAAAIAKEISLTYGQLATVAASALAGLWLYRIWIPTEKEAESALESQGLGLVYATLVGGAAFVGTIEPEPPMYGLLLLPGATIGLLAGSMFTQSSRVRVLAQIAGWAAVIAAGLIIVQLSKPPTSAEW